MGVLSSPFRSRVASRVFREFVLVLFLPLVALSWLGLRQATQQLEDQAYAHLGLATKDASMALLGRLQGSELDIEMLLGDLASTGNVPASSANPRLHDRLDARFRTLTIFPAQGRLDILAPVDALPALEPDEAEHLASGAMALIVRDIEGSPRILALRDLDAFGIGPGTLVGELRTESFLPVEGNQGLALLQRGRLLHTTDPDVLTPEALAGLELDQDGQRMLDVRIGPDLASVREVFLRPQYGLNLTLLMAQPEAAIIAPIAQFRTLFLLTATLSFLVVFFVGLKRLQKNLTPIALLNEATRRVAGGDLESRVEIRTADEFQDLGEAFNAMAERVRTRTRELVEANEAKGRFLANVSHEVRTPLSSILGYADLCIAVPDLTPELHENLDVIRTSGRHLLRLINDVLDVSRIEAGKLEIQVRRCSPYAVLQEAVRIVEPQLRARALTLESTASGPVPATIETDPDRLRQILVNLVSNAAKFTEKGRVSITVAMRSEEKRLAFVVEDTGPGIEPALRERLFQPFSQGDSSMSRKHGGAGLGLSIARELTRMLGGELTMQSRMGVGSLFTAVIDPGRTEGLAEGTPVRLHGARATPPTSSAEAVPAPPAPLPTAKASQGAPSGRVLVVEDVAVNRILAVRYLQGGGFGVDQAENGREAVEKALAAWREGKPHDLVLMDMQMPVMDGYEATRTLRSLGHDGAILAYTAHAVGEERERILATGCDHLVTKPIDRGSLLEVVRRFLKAPSHAAPEVAALDGTHGSGTEGADTGQPRSP